MKTDFLFYDKRDGQPSEHLQFKTWTEILGCAWNEVLDRSISGFGQEPHEKQLKQLLNEAKRKGEHVIAASFSNYAVSIAVKP